MAIKEKVQKKIPSGILLITVRKTYTNNPKNLKEVVSSGEMEINNMNILDLETAIVHIMAEIEWQKAQETRRTNRLKKVKAKTKK